MPQMALLQQDSRRVIAVIDWVSSSLLKENVRFFQAAANAGKVRPREWRDGSANFRSLIMREDGSCELQRFSTAAVARRLGWSIVKRTARKVRMVRRG
ncbi:MAG: hypothetical protein ACYC9Y_02255 [Candidatus Methylomirabilia bacterium]